MPNFENVQQYLDYQMAVTEFFRRESIRTMAPSQPDADPHYSKHACECCDCHLAGTRETYAADNGCTYEICPDCVYYLAYGRLDDMTMIRLGL